MERLGRIIRCSSIDNSAYFENSVTRLRVGRRALINLRESRRRYLNAFRNGGDVQTRIGSSDAGAGDGNTAREPPKRPQGRVCTTRLPSSGSEAIATFSRVEANGRAYSSTQFQPAGGTPRLRCSDARLDAHSHCLAGRASGCNLHCDGLMNLTCVEGSAQGL